MGKNDDEESLKKTILKEMWKKQEPRKYTGKEKEKREIMRKAPLT